MKLNCADTDCNSHIPTPKAGFSKGSCNLMFVFENKDRCSIQPLQGPLKQVMEYPVYFLSGVVATWTESTGGPGDSCIIVSSLVLPVHCAV